MSHDLWFYCTFLSAIHLHMELFNIILHDIDPLLSFYLQWEMIVVFIQYSCFISHFCVLYVVYVNEQVFFRFHASFLLVSSFIVYICFNIFFLYVHPFSYFGSLCVVFTPFPAEYCISFHISRVFPFYRSSCFSLFFFLHLFQGWTPSSMVYAGFEKSLIFDGQGEEY